MEANIGVHIPIYGKSESQVYQTLYQVRYSRVATTSHLRNRSHSRGQYFKGVLRGRELPVPSKFEEQSKNSTRCADAVVVFPIAPF